MQLSPLITMTQGRTLLSNGMLTSDTLTGQYGGRLTWTLFGSSLRSFLTAPTAVRVFNVLMAALLLASLYPVFMDA